jgi:cytochrome c biogenesis protein CcmG, thiol:disulfide interchange protein DsbE
MKKSVVVISLLLLTSCTQTNMNSDGANSSVVKQVGEVIDCKDILQEKLWTGGTSLDCLDQSEGAQLGALRGPMIVNVWGSWCGPCVEEIPYFVSFYEKAKGIVQLVGVNVEEANLQDAKKFVVSNGITWPNLYDSDGRSRQYFGLGVPVTWFIKPNGDVAYKHIGVITSESELIELTKKHLGIAV